MIAQSGKSHYLLTQRTRKRTKKELEEQKEIQTSHERDLKRMKEKLDYLTSKIDDYKKSLENAHENEEKLLKLYDAGIIDHEGNPKPSQNNTG